MDRRSAFFLLGIAGLALTGCNGSEGGDLATVNGEAITYAEYHEYLAVKPTATIIVNPMQLRIDPSQNNMPPQPYSGRIEPLLGFQALTDLIRNRILEQLAAEMGVKPNKAQIDEEIKFREKENPNFVKDLTGRGMTLDMIRKDLALQMCLRGITTKGVTPASKEDVDEFIRENPQQFTYPERATVMWVAVKDEKTRQQAEDDLKSGQMFAVVAQRYNLEQFRQSYQRNDEVRKYPAAVQKLIKETPELSQTGWIKENNSWWKFYISKKEAERKITPNDWQREIVKRAIEQRRGSTANDIDKKVLEKLLASKIEITPEHLKNQWKQYIEKLAAQNKDNSAPTIPGETGGTNPSGTTGTAGTTGG